MDKNDLFEALRVKKAKFEAEHPGHCGGCGLPVDYCYHQLGEFKSEMAMVQESSNVDTYQGRVRAVTRRFYRAMVEGMTPEEIVALPEPPVKWQAEILHSFKPARDRFARVLGAD